MSKLYTALFFALAMALTACGQDNPGVPVKLAQSTPITPDSITDKALELLKGEEAVHKDSASNKLIRAEMAGMNFAMISDSEKTKVRADITQMVKSSCTIVKYSAEVPRHKQTSWIAIDGLGKSKCIDGNCLYVLVILSPNIEKMKSGTVGAVPVILQNIGNNSFVPTKSKDPLFLEFENDTNIICMKPVNPETGKPYDPKDKEDDYSYLPPDDNNTWLN